MTLEEFVAILSDEYATAEFEYNGQQCGVEPQTQAGHKQLESAPEPLLPAHWCSK